MPKPMPQTVADAPGVVLPTTFLLPLVLGEPVQELVLLDLLIVMATNSQMAAKSTC